MSKNLWQRTVGTLIIVTGLVVVGRAQETTSLSAADCALLKDFSSPASAIALPTSGAVVQTAVAVGASDQGNANGDFCKVVGIVKPKNPGSPNLEFEVNLPLSWNRRALQMGGGGYDGSLVTGLTPFTLQPANTPAPLRQGFGTLGTAGGHQGAQGSDGRFGWEDEALLICGKQAIKKAHDAAMAVIRKAYGGAPDRVYFIGGSRGGNEALDAPARYPED